MGEVLPITPALQPHVDTILRAQRRARQRYNFVHHGLPVLGAAAVLGVTGTIFGFRAASSEADRVEPRCGIGVTEPGEGHYSVLDGALASAGVTERVDGYDAAAARMIQLDPELHPGERFTLVVRGGEIILDSVQKVTQPVNSCADLAATRRNSP